MFLPQRARRSTRPRARSFRPSSTLTALGPVRTSSATPPPWQGTVTQVVQCASPPAAPVQSRTAHRGRTCRERRERGRGRAVGVVAVVVAGVAVDVLVLVIGVVAVNAVRPAVVKIIAKKGRPRRARGHAGDSTEPEQAVKRHTPTCGEIPARARSRARSTDFRGRWRREHTLGRR
jgi:hypothetical protein